MSTWNAYQERVASFFRDLGLQAETNATLKGVRTIHDIDVVVRSSHVGFDLLWLIECKYWQRRVSKLHVLALREIVADIGADRGILMAEEGFQSGALEAAQLTNVQLTSLAELSIASEHDIGMAQLRTLQERLTQCARRYSDIDKPERIKHGLRSEICMPGYSGYVVIKTVETALNMAFIDGFPVVYNKLLPFWLRWDVPPGLADREGVVSANTPGELLAILEPQIKDLEDRLDTAEIAICDASESE